MTDRPDPGPEGDADLPAGAPQRWQHPSEVGLAQRGRTDRRRTTAIAAGVLLGGLGLLVYGVMLGTMDHADERPDTSVADRIEQSVANVVIVTDGMSATTTGLVLDEGGHLLVSAADLRGADEIWARCADGHLESASLVAVDDDEDLAVVRISSPAGRPAELSEHLPEPGTGVVAADAVPGAVTVGDATVVASTASTPPDRFHAELASPRTGTALLFDEHGALLGLTTTASDDGAPVEVRTAADVLGTARRLIES